MRNLTLIKCTPGYPVPMFGGSAVLGVMSDHRQVTVERTRFVVDLTADLRAQKQIVPSIVSAPPHERGT